jgi:uncharacterized damage-inducible protein DinB
MASYQGGCHCGAVRFSLELDGDPREVLDCNCSICSKKGFLHLIVPDAALRPTGAPTTYTFGTHVAKHMFCATCGIHAYYRPRSHPESWDVNVRCLDGVPLSHWQIRPFDSEHWEAAAEQLAAPGLVERMALSNAWANHRLHEAVAKLDDASYRATRTSFFPSIHRTLAHILFVDEYYVGALEGHPVDRASHWAANDRFDETGTFAELRARQRDVDRRLLALASSPAKPGTVALPRERGLVSVDTAEVVMLHVLLHSVHHRGQAHAMLAGTEVAPPQLDEGILDEDRELRLADLRAMGLREY